MAVKPKSRGVGPKAEAASRASKPRKSAIDPKSPAKAGAKAKPGSSGAKAIKARDGEKGTAVLLRGGNPQMAKADGAAPVRAYTAAMPGWKRAVGAAPAPASATPRGLDVQVREIAARLRCPVCQNESVADSPSELAAQMRALIRTKLEQGQSPEVIVAYFVSRYGEWILLEPPRRGIGWVVWIAPALTLIAGVLIAVRFLRRTVRPDHPPRAPTSPEG